MSPDTESGELPNPGSGTRRSVVILGVLWMSLIFGTSCTVVRPHEFFEWIHVHLLVDEAVFAKFTVFWGLCWFAIVKGWHALEFAILFWICSVLLTRWSGRRTQRTIAAAMLFCICFAISDEWHQSFVPDRMGTVTDVLIDSLGILTAGGNQLRKTHDDIRRNREPVLGNG